MFNYIYINYLRYIMNRKNTGRTVALSHRYQRGADAALLLFLFIK